MEDSAFGRLVSVFTAPAKTFESIAERPTWLVALLTLMLSSLTLMVIVTPRVDVEEMVQTSVEQQGRQMTAEQLDQAIEFTERFKWPMMLVPVVVFTFPVYLIMALVFWVAFKLGGSDIGYKASLATTTHGMLPFALAALIAIPLMLTRATVPFEMVQRGSLLMSNLGFLAGEESGAWMKSLLGSVDFFSIWSVVLLSLGFTRTARVSTGAAAGTVGVLWFVAVAGKAGLAAIFA